MKILYLTYDGLFDPLGRSQILPYLQGLKKNVDRIQVVSLEKNKSFPSQKEIEQLQRRTGLDYQPLLFEESPKGISTFLNIRRMKKKVREISEKNSWDIIHIRSIMPYLSFNQTKWAKNIPVIFDMRGFWADERIDGNIWDQSNPIFKLAYKKFKNYEQELISDSSAIISLTHNARSEIIDWYTSKSQKGSLGNFPIKYGADPAKLEEIIKVIPTCVDTDLFDYNKVPEEKTRSLKKELNIDPKDLVLCYQGSLGTWYLKDEMLEFFFQLQKQNQNIHWLIISNDPRDQVSKWLRKSAENQSLIKKISIVNSDRDQMPEYLSLTDIGLFFIQNKFSKKASAATKTGEFLAMGKPVISNSGWGDVELFARKYPEFFFLRDDFDPERLKKIRVRENIESIKVNARKLALDYFSLKRGVENYLTIYKELAG